MANPLNTVSLVGRVSQDIRTFQNTDGSKSLAITLAVEDNYVSGKGADRKVQTNFVPLRAFIGSNIDGNGSWDRVGKGDLIAVSARITAKSYVKDGETVYPAPTIEVDGFPQFLEAKSVTEARAAKNAVASTPAAEESPEAQIARLQAELDNARAQEAATSPFVGAAA